MLSPPRRAGSSVAVPVLLTAVASLIAERRFQGTCASAAMAYGLKIFLAHLQVDLSPLTVRKIQLYYVKFPMTWDHSFAPIRSSKI